MADAIAYATRADLNAYIPGGVIALGVADTDIAVNTYLEAASRDIDRYAGVDWSVEPNGLRFGKLSENPKGLEPSQLAALKFACCAQAEYRIVKGPDWFINDQFEQISGPDFSTRGKQGRFGPKMREELQQSGLRQLGGGKLVQ